MTYKGLVNNWSVVKTPYKMTNSILYTAPEVLNSTFACLSGTFDDDDDNHNDDTNSKYFTTSPIVKVELTDSGHVHIHTQSKSIYGIAPDTSPAESYQRFLKDKNQEWEQTPDGKATMRVIDWNAKVFS